MNNDRLKAKTTRFLIGSFIGLAVFSVIVFNLLGIYMEKRSDETISEVGTLYMSGMNEQIAKDFEMIIELRFQQVEGLVSVVGADMTAQKLHEELAYRGQVRDFDYLAFYAADGTFESIYGEDIRPLNPEPFEEALKQKENRVAVGVDALGNEIILFAVEASYQMNNGKKSIALVAALPIEYIGDIFFQDAEDSLLYCHIIRPDGSFVVRNTHVNRLKNANWLQEDEAAEEYYPELSIAMEKGENFSTIIYVNGTRRQIYATMLPCSEWYLITVMPYGALDQAVDGLSAQRMMVTMIACGAILCLLIFIFIRYFALVRLQFKELEDAWQETEAARQEAVQATKAKSEFLSNMSHDIRTPMNAIVGMTAIATTHIDDQEQVRNCLRKITLSSKQLLGLINDVLDMSKIESGKMTLTMDQISLREVIESIVSIVQSQIKAKKQNFEVHIDRIDTENVFCDSVRLNQILLNLLSNAIKFTPENGTIQLSLCEESSPKGESYIRTHIRVKDNGIGMSPDFVEKLYESYSREDNTRVHKTEGAGLGMAITKYIIDAMEGFIEVESELGKGTEFHIVLDFEKAETPEVDMILPAWKTLIVDDDEVLCQTAVESLQSIGVKADWTLSGEEAIKLVLQHHNKRDDYQIVLLDWKLPGMNGIQVAREIRHHMPDEVPILLISAYDWSDFETEAREAGITGFIAKPLFKSTLFYGLRQHMGMIETLDNNLTQDAVLTGRHILLAEDNDLNWEIAQDLLSELGLELDWAENGQICLEMFQQSSEGYYDAILMDIRMPIMTGYEATEAIRALKRSDAANIPIIAMTADAFSEDIQRCLSYGMNDHVAKPIDIKEVANLLKKYISARK